jgi:hypothetical protein
VLVMVIITTMITKMMLIIMIMMKILYKFLQSVEKNIFSYFLSVSAGTVTRYGSDGPGFEIRWSDIFRTNPDRHPDPPSLLYNEY